MECMESCGILKQYETNRGMNEWMMNDEWWMVDGMWKDWWIVDRMNGNLWINGWKWLMDMDSGVNGLWMDWWLDW